MKRNALFPAEDLLGRLVEFENPKHQVNLNLV